VANARKTEIERTVKEEGVSLDLTMPEVRALYAVTNRVGGSPTEGPRGLIDNIRLALLDALGKDERSPNNWAQPEYRCFIDSTGLIVKDYQRD
jgi:hypothetical protein